MNKNTRKVWKGVVKRMPQNAYGVDRLAERARLKIEIEKHAQGGRGHVWNWGRDCDHCESTSSAELPAIVMELVRAQDRMYAEAEGPCSMWLDSEPCRDSGFRDHAAEAHENGNPYSVAV
jgi:hypothetical protein